MRSLWFGLVGILTVIALSLESGLSIYLQKHSIILVIGGTLFVYFFSTPDKVVRLTLRSIRMLADKEKKLSDYNDELAELVKNRSLSQVSDNPIINYAVELWEKGIEPNLFVVLVSQKRNELETETIDAVQAVKNLSKYPPALGMIGTVMGMIAMFSKIDSNKGSIGSDIALAMTATFFGLLVANALVSPLADRLQVRYVSQKRLYSHLYQILLLINQDEPAPLIEYEMEERAA